MWRRITLGPISELVNVIVQQDGSMRSAHQMPPMNAVLTQIFESFDEEGRPVYTPVTSVICCDKHMEQVLLDTARRMMADTATKERT